MMQRTFKTKQMCEAIRDIRLTDEERLIASNEIYEMLKANIAIAENNKGRDYILHIPERKLGKSYNLIKLAAETGYLIITHNAMLADYMRRDAKNKYGWNIDITSYRSIPSLIDGTHCDVMLKEEGVDIVDVRDRLNEHGLGYVSIVGIN